MSEKSDLRQVVQHVFDKRAHEIRISPSVLANEALAYLDPGHEANTLLALAANLQFRQIARELCRGFENEDAEPEHYLFEDFHKALQVRYPSARSARSVDPEYVLLSYMSGEDYAYNIQRLRREADAKTAHAQALEAYWEEQKAKKAA